MMNTTISKIHAAIYKNLRRKSTKTKPNNPILLKSKNTISLKAGPKNSYTEGENDNKSIRNVQQAMNLTYLTQCIS